MIYGSTPASGTECLRVSDAGDDSDATRGGTEAGLRSDRSGSGPKATADPVDRARPVRPGEALDEDRLRAFLAARFPDLDGPLAVEQFPGGHSNLTYLLHVGEQELVLRRPPFGSQVKSAHDMGREFRILSALHPVYPKVPRPVVYCEDPAVLGAPFYVMERVRGVILRGPRPPAGLPLPPNAMRALSTALVDGLAELHALDLETTGLAREGRPAGYVERQVRGWGERYRKARTDAIPQVERVAAWLEASRPAESGAAFLHGDYKYDNLVLDPADPTQIHGILDWEMSTVGDPLMDLGTTLGYWLDPGDPPEHRQLPFGPTLLEGNLTRAELVERYAARTGRDCSNVVFHYVFGLFKIAVIAQQIYKRFHEGKTGDPRFAAMLQGVRVLAATAERAIDKGRIKDLG